MDSAGAVRGLSRRGFGRLAAGLSIVSAGAAACGRPPPESPSTTPAAPPPQSGANVGFVLSHEQFTTNELLEQAQAADHWP
jgi:hypothetical protein